MILILSLLSSINFFVQPVLYYTPLKIIDSLGRETTAENIFYLEFNCAIPYNELTYKELKGRIISECVVKLNIVNLIHSDSIIDSLIQEFEIPSFSEAAKKGLVFYLQFGKYLTYGEYNWSIELRCADNQGVVEGQRKIGETDYKMSDILLAHSISIDTTGGYLTKGNLKIIPNPSGIFDEGTKSLFLYCELYCPISDSTEFTIIVSDTIGKVLRKIRRRIEPKTTPQAINLGFNIEALKPGEYNLKAAVEDFLDNWKIEKFLKFRIKKANEVAKIDVMDLPYYDAIEYFVSQKEYNSFLKLNEEGRRLYLKKFWEKHNYHEIAKRYEYADRNFGEGYLAGSKTDRGRIYIKYGPPDEIENKQFEEAKPYEYWQYYNGLEFIFVDIRGTQEYTLVWTNAPNEKSKPMYYNYLPSFKRRELEEKKE
jgi:GWxTD domain-containing protein